MSYSVSVENIYDIVLPFKLDLYLIIAVVNEFTWR